MSSMAALVLVPLLEAFRAFVLPSKGRLIGMLVALVQLPIALSLALQVRSAGPLRMAVGGWAAP